MNERILQLAKQAGLDDDMFPLDEWDNPELEKFAELIVRECCSAIRLDDVFTGGKFQGTILNHFGVKE
jgi:hypothetical protein